MSATPPSRVLRLARKVIKRTVPLGLALFFAPKILAFYICCGLADVLRNQCRNLATLDRYFAGNGVFTWLLSPVNLLLDLLAFPYRNRGIYKITDLPRPHQEEIQAVIAGAYEADLVGKLEARMGGPKRGMIFFKWYGKNQHTTLDIPAFQRDFKYVRTIGVSVFNKKQSTGKHYGPLRLTLRVLYNINDIESKDVYIKVGNRSHFWRENKLFIFDDTLQHQSFNESDGVRYCLFLDILRPSLCPNLSSALLSGIRLLMARVNFLFYRHWTFVK